MKCSHCISLKPLFRIKRDVRNNIIFIDKTISEFPEDNKGFDFICNSCLRKHYFAERFFMEKRFGKTELHPVADIKPKIETKVVYKIRRNGIDGKTNSK